MDVNSFLILGLGSMGKRRIRCLLALGVTQNCIIGYDIRKDRCEESKIKYHVRTVEDVESIPWDEIKAVIISLPPDKHIDGAKLAIDHVKPIFIEASVLLEDDIRIRDYNDNKVFIAPSNTFVHHPILKEVIKIIKGKEYGEVTNFSYSRGDFLPEWHIYEDVKEFYVSNPKTGAAREIIPFEMTWMVEAFGLPKDIKGFYRKTKCDIGCCIDDCYVAVLDYDDMLGVISINVSSRYVVQDLIVNLTEGQIRWRWDENRLCIYDAKQRKWNYIIPKIEKHEEGYLDFINEDMYIEETRKFIEGIENPLLFENTLDKDIKVLECLEILEKSDKSRIKDQVKK